MQSLTAVMRPEHRYLAQPPSWCRESSGSPNIKGLDALPCCTLFEHINILEVPLAIFTSAESTPWRLCKQVNDCPQR